VIDVWLESTVLWHCHSGNKAGMEAVGMRLWLFSSLNTIRTCFTGAPNAEDP
jgi:hypothetical protein